METHTKKDEECPKLLDLIQKNREWMEEKKLELRLGPPDGDWNKKDSSRIMSRGDEFHLSFGYLPNTISGNKRAFTQTVKNHVFSAPWSSSNGGGENQEISNASFLQLQQPSLKESSHSCCGTKGAAAAAATVDLQTGEKKAFSPPAAANITAVSNSNSAQKRTAPAPVVGWPPVRSFRRNITTSSNLKPNPVSQNAVSNKNCNEKPVEKGQKGLFVKINMDGVPIGRKVDLQVYDSYEKLSSTVDDLFRDLLAAQGDSSACGIKIKGEGGETVISGLLDGSGEYTLVYEDNEDDRMLVGDVPWHMFISTVKRLRVLKTSEISSLRIAGGSKLKEELS